MENYIIQYNLNGVEPKCQCGFCDERANYYRGKFNKYAKGHNTYTWHRKKYIEKQGYPKCLHCETPTGFIRKNPIKFCSQKCVIKYYNIKPPPPTKETIEKIKKSKEGRELGFNNPLIQKKIRANNLLKYGVENNSQRPEVKEKMSAIWTLEKRKNFSNFMSDLWKNEDYGKRVSKGINTFLKDETKDEKDIRLQKMFTGKNKFTKIHLKVKKDLNLKENGYIPEQVVAGYIGDEVNHKKKIVIEINGDYVHANPKYYKSDDIILMPGNKYTAQEKWDYDAMKKKKIENVGYKVITIWESDDLSLFKDSI